MKNLFIVQGGKGGVGKSITTSSAIDYILNGLNGTVHLDDADPSNPDVAKMYNDVLNCSYTNLDNKNGFLSLIDTIDTTDCKYIIVNCPARSLAWNDFGHMIFDNLSGLNCTMKTLWVLGRQRDSLEALQHYYDSMPETTIFPVINTYFGPKESFELWETSSKLKPAILKKGSEIVFPSCADRVTDVMRNKRLKWNDVSKMQLSHRIEVERFRKEVFKVLAPIFE